MLPAIPLHLAPRNPAQWRVPTQVPPSSRTKRAANSEPAPVSRPPDEKPQSFRPACASPESDTHRYCRKPHTGFSLPPAAREFRNIREHIHTCRSPSRTITPYSIWGRSFAFRHCCVIKSISTIPSAILKSNTFPLDDFCRPAQDIFQRKYFLLFTHQKRAISVPFVSFFSCGW